MLHSYGIFQAHDELKKNPFKSAQSAGGNNIQRNCVERIWSI
jgi:hypothetical protein